MSDKKLVIAVSKGHNVFNNKILDNGASFNGVMEAERVSLTVNILIPMLKSQGHIVVDVTPWREHFANSKAAHQERAKRVNEGTIVDGKRVPFDLYLDFHLNAGGGTGPEMWVYSTKGLSYEYARKLVNNIVADTKLRNRGVKVKPTMWSLSMPKPPSIIVEGGFIDSREDMKVLTPQLYAESIAKAFGELPKHEETDISRLYKVQVGAYAVKANAERLLKDLADKGFKGYIKEEGVEVVENNKYYKKGTTEVIELDPMDLKISVEDKPGNQINLKNFVTSGYQWHHANGSTYSLGILASENRGISNRQPHNKPAGTLLVHRDGTVAIKDIADLSKESMVRFAVSGCSILPDIKMESAGFVGPYSDIARKTDRAMIGYRKKDNKIIIAVDNCTISEGKNIMQGLGCDSAITLDGGGSTVLKVDNKMLRSTVRRLHSVITW